MGSVSQPIVAETEFVGVSAPPLRGFIYLTLSTQFSGSPRRLCLAKPLIIGLSPAIVGYRSWSRQLQPLVRRSARLRWGGFVPLNRSLTRLHPSPGIWRMQGSRLLCFVGRVAPPSSQPGVSSSSKRFVAATPVQPGPSRPEGDPASAGPSRRRSYDSPQGSFGHSSRQGSDTPPRKRRRLSDDSSADEDESSHTRRQRDDQQDDEDNFRPASLALLLDYITRKFPAASKPLVQPSSKLFHVFEVADLVDESSQPSSHLAWFGHMRTACDSAQSKFEAKILEGRPLSTLLPYVSRTERVSDSPCQGKAVKVNSQVYDLMSSKPSESRSVPLSVKEAAGLETTFK